MKTKRAPNQDLASSGSMIVDRVNEPLQVALDTYNSCINPFMEIPKKLKEYPNPRKENVRLVVHQQLIGDA